MAPFTIDNKCRTRQQKDPLAYVRELATRVPELNALRNYHQHDFDITLADFSEPTPEGKDRSTHEPTKTRENLATILALMVKGNAAAIVQDTDDATGGVAIFCKLVKAHGQSDGDGTAYLLQLRSSASTRPTTSSCSPANSPRFATTTATRLDQRPPSGSHGRLFSTRSARATSTAPATPR